jgi:hypothetical protein
MKIARAFLYTAATLFVITAAAKALSSFGNAKMLLQSDPIFGFQFRHLFQVVAALELAVAASCLRTNQVGFSTGLVAWLATTFIAYRLGLLWVGWHRPCSCLGNLTDALHIPPQTADNAMKVILAYLLIGSYASLFWLWRQRKKLALSLS